MGDAAIRLLPIVLALVLGACSNTVASLKYAPPPTQVQAAATPAGPRANLLAKPLSHGSR